MVDRAASLPSPTGDSSDSSDRGTQGALLGPQRLAITIGRELESFGAKGRVAAITAGWQEREAEDEELDDAIGNRALNLLLHARCDGVFRRDPELSRAHRAKQDVIRRLQIIHRIRLEHAVSELRELLELGAEDPLVEPEIESAFERLRELDEHHLARLDEEQEEFEARTKLVERDEVCRQREEIAAIIGRCDAVAIAGGHVAVLLNRLRLFRLAPILASRPLFAWSAGAMAVTEKVVVFHDNPPQGRGNAEVVARGLGLYPGVVVFPHAKRRLDLSEPTRVTLLGRRFAPMRCVTLDEEAGLRFRSGTVKAFGPAKLLLPDGRIKDAAGPIGGAP